MRLCSCGFANPDDAMRCAACGGAFSHESAGDTLLLEDVRSGEVVRIPVPGGILGRAGDFSPDLFSPRVSGVHAVVAVDSEGRWTIEHTGRNASAVERGGVWSDLRCGAPQPLFGGEMLKLADMVFRVRMSAEKSAAGLDAQVDPVGGDLGRPSPTSTVDELTRSNTAAGTEGGPRSAPTGGSATEEAVETAWSVRCPVCGTEYAVEGPESRIAACTFCKDPLDARQIARVAARIVPGR